MKKKQSLTKSPVRSSSSSSTTSTQQGGTPPPSNAPTSSQLRLTKEQEKKLLLMSPESRGIYLSAQLRKQKEIQKKSALYRANSDNPTSNLSSSSEQINPDFSKSSQLKVKMTKSAENSSERNKKRKGSAPSSSQTNSNNSKPQNTKHLTHSTTRKSSRNSIFELVDQIRIDKTDLNIEFVNSEMKKQIDASSSSSSGNLRSRHRHQRGANASSLMFSYFPTRKEIRQKIANTKKHQRRRLEIDEKDVDLLLFSSILEKEKEEILESLLKVVIATEYPKRLTDCLTFYLFHFDRFHSFFYHLIESDIANERTPNTLLRTDCASTLLMTSFLHVFCLPCIVQFLVSVFSFLDFTFKSLSKSSTIVGDDAKLVPVIEKFFLELFALLRALPPVVKEILGIAYHVGEMKFKGSGKQMVSSIFFLRFLCPALISPLPFLSLALKKKWRRDADNKKSLQKEIQKRQFEKIRMQPISKSVFRNISKIINKEGVLPKIIKISKLLQLMANQIDTDEFPVSLLPFKPFFADNYPHISNFLESFSAYNPLQPQPQQSSSSPQINIDNNNNNNNNNTNNNNNNNNINVNNSSKLNDSTINDEKCINNSKVKNIKNEIHKKVRKSSFDQFLNIISTATTSSSSSLSSSPKSNSGSHHSNSHSSNNNNNKRVNNNNNNNGSNSDKSNKNDNNNDDEKKSKSDDTTTSFSDLSDMNSDDTITHSHPPTLLHTNSPLSDDQLIVIEDQHQNNSNSSSNSNNSNISVHKSSLSISKDENKKSSNKEDEITNPNIKNITTSLLGVYQCDRNELKVYTKTISNYCIDYSQRLIPKIQQKVSHLENSFSHANRVTNVHHGDAELKDHTLSSTCAEANRCHFNLTQFLNWLTENQMTDASTTEVSSDFTATMSYSSTNSSSGSSLSPSHSFGSSNTSDSSSFGYSDNNLREMISNMDEISSVYCPSLSDEDDFSDDDAFFSDGDDWVDN